MRLQLVSGIAVLLLTAGMSGCHHPMPIKKTPMPVTKVPMPRLCYQLHINESCRTVDEHGLSEETFNARKGSCVVFYNDTAHSLKISFGTSSPFSVYTIELAAGAHSGALTVIVDSGSYPYERIGCSGGIGSPKIDIGG